MRRAGLLFATLLITTGPAYADNDRVQRAPAPDWVVPSEPLPVPENASGLVFVRSNDTLVHLDDQGQASYVGYRIKILHPNALQAGNLAISWNPSAGAATVHAVRVYRDGAAIDVLDNAQFEILRREDQLEAARLTGILTAVLRVPDLRVGDELEVALTIRSSEPTLGTNEAGVLMLSPTPAPGRFRLGLSWQSGQEPNFRMTPDMAAVAEGAAGPSPSTSTIRQRSLHPMTRRRVTDGSALSSSATFRTGPRFRAALLRYMPGPRRSAPTRRCERRRGGSPPPTRVRSIGRAPH